MSETMTIRGMVLVGQGCAIDLQIPAPAISKLISAFAAEAVRRKALGEAPSAEEEGESLHRSAEELILFLRHCGISVVSGAMADGLMRQEIEAQQTSQKNGIVPARNAPGMDANRLRKLRGQDP